MFWIVFYFLLSGWVVSHSHTFIYSNLIYDHLLTNNFFFFFKLELGCTCPVCEEIIVVLLKSGNTAGDFSWIFILIYPHQPTGRRHNHLPPPPPVEWMNGVWIHFTPWTFVNLPITHIILQQGSIVQYVSILLHQEYKVMYSHLVAATCIASSETYF